MGLITGLELSKMGTTEIYLLNNSKVFSFQIHNATESVSNIYNFKTLISDSPIDFIASSMLII